MQYLNMTCFDLIRKVDDSGRTFFNIVNEYQRIITVQKNISFFQR
jgi:hypothetical protein